MYFSEEFSENFFNQAETLIRTGLWNKITIQSFISWKKQFKTYEDKFFAAYLASKLLYYTDKDFIALIKWSIQEMIKIQVIKIIGNRIASDLKWKNTIDDILKSIIICDMSMNDTTSSAHIVARLIRDLRIGIPDPAFISPQQLYEYLLKPNYKTLVFVDDVIGSGDQVKNFFNESVPILNNKVCQIKQLISEKDIDKYIVVAIAAKETIDWAEKYSGCKIIYAEKLTEIHSVDSPKFWHNDDFEDSKVFFQRLYDNHQISLKGWNNKAWSIAFSHGVPDFTSPFYYHESDDWVPLVRRRGEDV